MLEKMLIKPEIRLDNKYSSEEKGFVGYMPTSYLIILPIDYSFPIIVVSLAWIAQIYITAHPIWSFPLEILIDTPSNSMIRDRLCFHKPTITRANTLFHCSGFGQACCLLI